MAPAKLEPDPRDQASLFKDNHHPDGAPLTSSEIEAEADVILGISHAVDEDSDTAEVAPNEIELVFTGLLRNQRGAQASAAHWEAKRLSDDDLDQLGYTPNNEETS